MLRAKGDGLPAIIHQCRRINVHTYNLQGIFQTSCQQNCYGLRLVMFYLCIFHVSTNLFVTFSNSGQLEVWMVER
jgi:hypothetical protein